MLYRFDGCDKSYSVFLPKQRRSESTARLILFSTSLSLPLSLSLSRCSANIIYDFKTNLLTRFFINIRLKSNKLISAPSLITGGHASWAHILYSIKYEIDVYFFWQTEQINSYSPGNVCFAEFFPSHSSFFEQYRAVLPNVVYDKSAKRKRQFYIDISIMPLGANCSIVIRQWCFSRWLGIYFYYVCMCVCVNDSADQRPCLI